MSARDFQLSVPATIDGFVFLAAVGLGGGKKDGKSRSTDKKDPGNKRIKCNDVVVAGD